MQRLIDNFILPALMAILVLFGAVAFVEEDDIARARSHPCYDAPCNW